MLVKGATGDRLHINAPFNQYMSIGIPVMTVIGNLITWKMVFWNESLIVTIESYKGFRLSK